MTRRREPLQPPRDYMTRGDWPNGIIAPNAPPAVHYMAHIARAAQSALDDRGISRNSLAAMCNFDPSTVRLLLNGYAWPDMVTIIKLEQILEMRLWPAYGDEIFPIRRGDGHGEQHP